MTKTKVWVGLLAVAMLAPVGCTKKIDLTIMNHTNVARTLNLSTPEETMAIGAVSAGGRLSTKLAIKSAELPAQCSLSADGGASQSFMVTEDSPSKWWFHITTDGRLVGPYREGDRHTETILDGEITLPGGPPRTILR